LVKSIVFACLVPTLFTQAESKPPDKGPALAAAKGAAATPEFSPAAGSYQSTQTVTLTDVTPGAVVYYTTDGSTPTTKSAQYTSPFTVATSGTIKAIATASEYSESAIASADYKVGASPQPACGGCYATVGLGANINSKGLTDYNNSSNILESTHLGNGTPQLLLGVSFQVPWHGIFYHEIQIKSGALPSPDRCDPLLYNQDVDGAKIYCYPWRPFISVKFTPDASQTFNGFTYGISHRLAKNLDLMVGVSYTAFNEASPGFQRAAIETVKTQQAAGNPYYTQFSLVAMQNNWRNAFDGLPTQLISSTGQPGALIYSGNPLSVHYHPGGFIGIVVPISIKTFVGLK
jgi:hypothetical protein